jgi:hypothetical protein
MVFLISCWYGGRLQILALALKELKVFETRVMRVMFGTKREEVTVKVKLFLAVIK